MKATKAEVQKILQALQEFPAQLSSLTAGLKDDVFAARVEKDEWSAAEILAHLRACADVWGASMKAMLNQDEPRLADIHPRKWIKNTNYTNLAFGDSFAAYKAQREGLMQVLSILLFESWSRGAQIGSRRHTVFSQARRMAKHEAEHLHQMEAVVAGAESAPPRRNL